MRTEGVGQLPVDSLLLGVSEDVRLEVCRLCELLIAAVEGTHVRSVSRVNADVRAQVEIERKSLATPLKRALQATHTRQIVIHGTVDSRDRK